jgi:hypothetical protein
VAVVLLLDPTEPLFVWAVTVVLSPADVVVLVASDADEDEDAEETEEADDEAAAADDVEVVSPASDVELDGVVDAEPDVAPDELSDPAWPAELDEEEEDEDDEDEDEDEESSARALATSGAASDAPNSAALTPADAAPTCNHRRTPKFSARRPDPLTDRPFECADIYLPLRQLFAGKQYNEGVNIAATCQRNLQDHICGSTRPDLLHYRQYNSTQTR